MSDIQIAGVRATNILIAPLNMALPIPSELDTSRSLVFDALVEHVESKGKSIQILSDRRGHALWRDAARTVTKSGETRNFESAIRVFISKAEREFEFDTLIVPSIYIQNAAIGVDAARWDSASQKIEFIGHEKWEVELPPLTTIPAASILIYVYDRNGKEIHTKRTGLELIQHLEIRVRKQKGHDQRTWTLTNDSPPLEDMVRIRAGVAHAMSPYLPE